MAIWLRDRLVAGVLAACALTAWGEPAYVLKVDSQRGYVLGEEPILIETVLRGADKATDALMVRWPEARRQGGLTYTLTSAAGVTVSHQVQPDWEGGRGSESFDEGIDLKKEAWVGGLTPGRYTLTVAMDGAICNASEESPCGTRTPGLAVSGIGVVGCVSVTKVPCDTLEWGPYRAIHLQQRVVFDLLPEFVPRPGVGLPAGVADAQIARWVTSGSPRLIAWAAYFAVRDRPAGAAEELKGWLTEQLEKLPAQTFDQIDEYDPETLESRRAQAAYAVLDALIQSKTRFSAAEIGRIDRFNHLLGLVCAMSPEVNQAALEQYFDRRAVLGTAAVTTDDVEELGSPVLWRTAGAALARGHSAALLKGLTGHFVLDLSFRMGGPSMTICNVGCSEGYEGVAYETGMPAGWPPIGTYGLMFAKAAPPAPEASGPGRGAHRLRQTFGWLVPGSVRYVRTVARSYRFEPMPNSASTLPDALDGPRAWLEQYGRRGERFVVDKSVTGGVPLGAVDGMMRSWLGEQVETFHRLLADAGIAPAPLHLTMQTSRFGANENAYAAPDSIPQPGGNGFPPVDLIIDKWR